MSWKRLRSEIISEHKIFRLRRDALVPPGASESFDFHVIECGDWVNVIPTTDDGRIVMVDQYRAGVERRGIEIPGGLIDPGETPEAAAHRELREETGHSCEELISLGSIAPNPAMQSNLCHCFWARGCKQAFDLDLDDAEDITVQLVSEDEVMKQLADGTIEHALVAVAFARWALRHGTFAGPRRGESRRSLSSISTPLPGSR